jgi:hypothetical protein
VAVVVGKPSFAARQPRFLQRSSAREKSGRFAQKEMKVEVEVEKGELGGSQKVSTREKAALTMVGEPATPAVPAAVVEIAYPPVCWRRRLTTPTTQAVKTRTTTILLRQRHSRTLKTMTQTTMTMTMAMTQRRKRRSQTWERRET